MSKLFALLVVAIVAAFAVMSAQADMFKLRSQIQDVEQAFEEAFGEEQSQYLEVGNLAKGAYVLSIQKCSASSPWTLHGLWPQNGQFCTDEAFDVNKVALLRKRLDANWMSCPGHQGNIAFWKHEWSKHGTCSKFSQFQYFSNTLQLLERFRPSCASVTKGECRICLNADFSRC